MFSRLLLAGFMLRPLPSDLQHHILKFMMLSISCEPDRLMLAASFQKLFGKFVFDFHIGMSSVSLRLSSDKEDERINAQIKRASRIPLRHLCHHSAFYTAIFIQYVMLVFQVLDKLTIDHVYAIANEISTINQASEDGIEEIWVLPLECLLGSNEPFQLWQTYWMLYDHEFFEQEAYDLMVEALPRLLPRYVTY
jgi:hypothetical protein